MFNVAIRYKVQQQDNATDHGWSHPDLVQGIGRVMVRCMLVKDFPDVTLNVKATESWL